MQTFLNHKFDNNFVFITGLSILRVIGNYKYIFYDKYLAQLQLHISNSRVYLKKKKKKL